MIYRAFLLLVAVVLFSGCTGINTYNPFDESHPVTKEEVKKDINIAIEKKNALVDILTRALPPEELKSPRSIQLDDRRMIVQALARQGVMIERAKHAIQMGEATKEEFFYLYNLLAEGYVSAKTIINRYTDTFGPSKMASFVLFEDKISAKGREVEAAFEELNDTNSNDLFKLIMQQAALMNEVLILAVSK